jgi:AraC-like DNA-binding protein
MNKVLFHSDLVTVLSVTCDLRRSGPTTSYHVADTFVALPLRGIFTMHVHRAEHLLHPMLGAVVPADTEYRMSHPNDDGDTGVALRFAPSVVAEALGEQLAQVRVTRADVRMRHAVGVLLARIAGGHDAFVIDGHALDLLGIVAGDLRAVSSVNPSKARGKIDRVRMVLAEQPETHWTLGGLASLVGYSPFHLAHQFRAHTGTSVHQYLADLRAAAALSRIEAGDASLATVAADLGFAHHSHLTATLRKRLGMTPRTIRRRLRSTDVANGSSATSS